MNIKAALGTWGFSHGVIVAVAMYAMWATDYGVPVAGAVGGVYYCWREYTARKKDGTPNFKNWYFDSQMDAAVPVIVAIVGTVIRYWGSG